MVRRTLGHYVAVCPCLQLTSHTQPTSTLSRIKYERYIFIKKCVHSFIEVIIIVDSVSAYICLCMWLYNIKPVSWSCKIYQLYLFRGVRLHSTPSTSVLDMTLNHLIMWLQSWIFRECGVPLHCYYSQVHCDLDE